MTGCDGEWRGTMFVVVVGLSLLLSKREELWS